MPPDHDLSAEVERTNKALKDDGYGTYLSRAEVQRALSISPGTVYQLQREDLLPAIKLRSHFRFLRLDVARFAVMGSVRPTRH